MPEYTGSDLLDLHKRACRSHRTMLDHLALMPEGSLKAVRDGFGMQTIREQLLHITSAEEWWMHLVMDKEYHDPEESAIITVEGFIRRFSDVADLTQGYLRTVSPEVLNTEKEFVFPDGKSMLVPSLVIMHLITHGYHHKGQVAAMCRALGHPAPDTDMYLGEL